MKKYLFIVTSLILFLILGFTNTVRANTAIFYPSEIEINIYNLPKNEKNEIEVRIVKEAIDILGADPRSYSHEAYENIAKESDGTFTGPKEVFKGRNPETKELTYEQEDTIYYYKTLFKKTISNKNNEKIKILTGNIDLSSYREIIVMVNNQYSTISRIGSGGEPNVKRNCFNLNYETLKLDRDMDIDETIASTYNFKQNILLNIILCVLFTLIIELTISKLFKIKNGKIILKINLLTQSILHILTIIILSTFFITYNTYLYVLMLLEIIIIISEILLYKLKLKDIPTNKLIIFSIIANTCSFLTSPLLYMIISKIIN